MATASPSSSSSSSSSAKVPPGEGERGSVDAGAATAEAGAAARPTPRARFGLARVSTLTWAVLGGVAAGAWAKLAMGMGMGPPLVMTGLGGFTLVLAAAALWRVVDPLTRAETRAPADLRAPQRIRELEREKQAVLKALKEIELDYQMRKISEPDYREMIERYRARALRILGDLAAGNDYRVLIERELKGRLAVVARVGGGVAVGAGPGAGAVAVASSGPAPAPAPGSSGSLAEAPTAAAAGISRLPPSAASTVDTKAEAGAISQATDEPRPLRCTSCQTVNDLDAEFCKRCGKNLLSPASSVPA